MRTVSLFSIVTAVILLASCANNRLTGDTYSRKNARKVQQVEYGQVLSVVQEVQEVQDNHFFSAGDRVRLLSLNGVTRVSY